MSWGSGWLAFAIATTASVVVAQGQTQGKPNSAEAQAAAELQTDADRLTTDFWNYLFYILAFFTVVLAVWRVFMLSTRYVRLLVCLGNGTQRYFLRPFPAFAAFKKNVLYAPIFHKRHNREFRLSESTNMGTLPTRLQLMFLIGYFGTNVAFCVVSIHWSEDIVTVAKELRNRCGVLALANLIPIFVMAARNNPLIRWLDLSFDTFNLLHRWLGRTVFLEVLCHAASWMVYEWKTAGPAAIPKALRISNFITFGLITLVALTAITIQSLSVIRHSFYEFFKYFHIALAILLIIALWYHLTLSGVPFLQLLIGVIAIWAAERVLRVVTLVWRNVGRGGSKATIEALPGGAVRVTCDLARPWTFKPGQHAYLYMPSIGLFTSHPFSAAWSQEDTRIDEKFRDSKSSLPTSQQDLLSIQRQQQRHTSISFVVRVRTGFTSTLQKKALAAPEGRFTTTCFVEGPYGGHHDLTSYGTVMLFAGGIGITHQIPQILSLIQGFSSGTTATRKILLVWVIQSPEHLEWIRPWMTDILAMDRRRDVLRIMLFVSRPKSTKEIHSPSATVQMFPGRPNFDTLLERECEDQVGAMAVSCCGSGSMSDDVRSAVRKRMDSRLGAEHVRNVDYFEEAFSW